MDDLTFQRWSDALAELRTARQSLISGRLTETERMFIPKDFFSIARQSVDQIMEKWFSLERQSCDANSSLNPPNLGTIKDEMESIVELEMDAIERDLAQVRFQTAWSDQAIAEAKPDLSAFLEELRDKYQVKINTLANGSRKKSSTHVILPSVTKQSFSGSYGGRGGLAVFTMFLVGIIVGGGPSVYFWDASKTVEKKLQEETQKFRAEQNALRDSMNLLQSNYYELATGKMKNLPELEKDISNIRDGFVRQKKELDREFARKRGNILRKVSADELDGALDKLENDKARRLEIVNAREEMALELLLQQQQSLKELMER